MTEEGRHDLLAAAAFFHVQRSLRDISWVDQKVAVNFEAPTKWDLVMGLSGAISLATGDKPAENHSVKAEMDDVSGELRVTIDGSIVLTVDGHWPLETELAHLRVNGEREIVVQFLQPRNLGFQLQYLGTKVRWSFWTGCWF